jgi:Flagellar biosynthesis protein, FliO
MTLIDQGDGMQVLRKLGRKESRTMAAVTVPPVQGLAGWVLGLLQNWRGQRETQRKQLRLVETLSLGGKRQLMLVTCGGESFLVGGGPESVETIVRLKTEVWPDMTSKSLDEPCR